MKEGIEFSIEHAKQIENHDELLLGRKGEPGMVHKVGFMWRIQVWIIGIIGVAAGYLIKWVADMARTLHGS